MAKIRISVAGAVAVSVMGAVLPAAAQEYYRPLTVVRPHASSRFERPVGPGVYDPYHGPAVLVTGPIHLAATAVDLPFRIVNAVFPSQGPSPLTLVGGPVAAAGRLAQLPFRIIEAPFGGPDPFRY